jgi:hypothetical protein
MMKKELVKYSETKRGFVKKYLIHIGERTGDVIISWDVLSGTEISIDPIFKKEKDYIMKSFKAGSFT